MRCRLGEKKLRKYSRITGMKMVDGLVRGNTNHRVDLRCADGSGWSYWPNGVLKPNPSMGWIEIETREDALINAMEVVRKAFDILDQDVMSYGSRVHHLLYSALDRVDMIEKDGARVRYTAEDIENLETGDIVKDCFEIASKERT